MVEVASVQDVGTNQPSRLSCAKQFQQKEAILVRCNKKTCNLPRILRNIRLSVRFHCESQACHAFYAAFSVLKLRVNLLFKTKRKSNDKTVKDGPTLESV